MTVRDFKAAILSVMKDKIEQQRVFSIAVAVAIASAFDAKAVKASENAINKLVGELDGAQEEMYLGARLPVNKAKEKRSEDGGLDRKSVETWQTLTKLDAGFTKMTGKMTGAPWSSMNQGSQNLEYAAHASRASATTGDQIMQKVAAGAAREGRMNPGRRR